MLDMAFRLREKADYEDFVIVSVEMSEEQLVKAGKILNIIKEHLEKRWV